MSERALDTITFNGVEYVKKDSITQLAVNTEGLTHCIVRTYSAGVFAGFLALKEGKEVTLRNARRLWYWKGAASLSQLAMDGVSCPDECKFPVEVSVIYLTEAIEIIPCSTKAKASIDSVKIWKS